MNIKRYYLYIFLGALIYSLVSVFQTAPGYMDADYYTAGGIQLAGGAGFHEPFIWNYLNNPMGIPTRSHLYWMPLASILAAVGAWVSGTVQFVWLRAPFVLLAVLVAPLSVGLARKLVREQRYTWLAGFCGLFAGIYWIYLTLPETFGLYMLLGAGVIGLAGGTNWLRIANGKALALGVATGILSGLMHLTRADGILWLAGSLLWVIATIIFGKDEERKTKIFRIAITFGTIIIGYLMVMSAWYARNLVLFDSLMPPANAHAFWLTDYNQTYNLSAGELSFSAWISSGIRPILLSRWQALKTNLGSLLVVQGGIVLLPLMVIGFIRNWRDNRLRFLLLMWLLTFLTMTIIFPYAGARGGYLHSGAAFQPFLWALVPAGLEAVVEWGSRKRGWAAGQAFTVFGTGLMVIVLAMSGYFYTKRVIGSDLSQPIWNESERIYQAVGGEINELGIGSDEIGIVNNPPGYFLATGRASIVVPNGGLENLIAAAGKFNASYLVLEEGQANLSVLYAHPGDREGVVYLGIINGAQIYRIIPYDCDC